MSGMRSFGECRTLSPWTSNESSMPHITRRETLLHANGNYRREIWTTRRAGSQRCVMRTHPPSKKLLEGGLAIDELKDISVCDGS